jgi:predicted nucleotidyltransferase
MIENSITNIKLNSLLPWVSQASLNLFFKVLISLMYTIRLTTARIHRIAIVVHFYTKLLHYGPDPTNKLTVNIKN